MQALFLKDAKRQNIVYNKNIKTIQELVMKRKTSAFIVPVIVFCFFLSACGKVNASNYNSITESIQASADSSSSTETSLTASVSSETSAGTSFETSGETSASTSETSVSASETETSVSDSTSASTEEPEVITIRFYITNLCGVDIGMVSTLNPISAEQMDLGDLPADKIMTLDFEWPKAITTFHMAIYNMAGDLVSVSEIDITGVKESVVITLSGDKNLDRVDTTIN